ncbi:hypothetical protein, partial [Luteimonas panaciterrae]|uniref:hypothetical protein n=1 Tax=Luteimonas panaciterrae TaxID=363885 RepID=UPI001CFA90D8
MSTVSRLSLALLGAMAAITTTVPASAQEAQAGSDPLFKYQWHLRNYGQGAGVIADTAPKHG